jgi:hypothetical protein
MASVYLETTVPSYLAAFPSRDLIIAAHQQITHEWWREARGRFDLYISDAVIDEIAGGDSSAVSRRMNFVTGLTILASNDTVEQLVREYLTRLRLQGKATADIPHFAFAVAYEMDYLVTWNCKHLANGEIVRRLISANTELGFKTPLIVTPQELQYATE